MDNLTHSLFGWVLARAGAERLGPWVTPTLVVAANLPDVTDLAFGAALRQPWSPALYLTPHYGLSHSLIGILPQSLLLALLVWAVGWLWRSKLYERPRFWMVLLISLLGVASHLLLDWLNTYGLALWQPWKGSCSYGDMSFIVDPWMWLILGAGVFLGSKQGPGERELRLFLCAVTTSLLLVAARKGIISWWVFGTWLALLSTVALLGLAVFRSQAPQTIARASLMAWTIYVAALLVASNAAAFQAFNYCLRLHSGTSWWPSRAISANPRPAVPWQYDVLLQGEDTLDWVAVDLLRGSLELRPLNPPLSADLHNPLLIRIKDTPACQAWLATARHPVWELRGKGEIGLSDMREHLLERSAANQLKPPPQRQLAQ